MIPSTVCVWNVGTRRVHSGSAAGIFGVLDEYQIESFKRLNVPPEENVMPVRLQIWFTAETNE